MIHLQEETLYQWLEDVESFSHAFKRYCFLNFRVFGLHAEFKNGALARIHEQWVAACKGLLEDMCHHTTEDLSSAKILAALLSSLVAEDFLLELYEYEYQDDAKYHFTGDAEQYKKARQDIIDGRDAVLSFDFVFYIFTWYEENNILNSSGKRLRFGPAMRHDTLSYLLNGNVDPLAIYLIFKALSMSLTEH